jgi:hypothetical protein
LKLPLFGVLASLVVFSLPAAAADKSADCRCASHSIVRRVIVHPAPHRADVKPAPHQTIIRREARHTIVVHKPARIVRARARDRYASSYYDYRSSSRVTETVETREYGMARHDWRMENGRYDRRDHYHNDRPDGGAAVVNPRDFNGGVGYGTEGGVPGGYVYGAQSGMNGRPIDNYGYHADAAGMARVRLNAWHGYNSHNGPGNGY